MGYNMVTLMKKVLFSTMALFIMSLLIVVGCKKDESVSNYSGGGGNNNSAPLTPTGLSAIVNGSYEYSDFTSYKMVTF